MKFLAALLLIFGNLGAATIAQDGPCRLALALGLDVSGSIDDEEYRLQLDGLAAALLAPAVQKALLITPEIPVELAIYEWSGLNQHRLLVDWTQITDSRKIAAIASRLRGTYSSYTDPSTAVGAAMVYGAGLLAQRKNCWQRTLDLSGDGAANTGPDPALIPKAITGGLTINGLVVKPYTRANVNQNLLNVKTLLEYYQTQVIRGPGAFVEVAGSFSDYKQAMTRKLLRELAGQTISQSAPAIVPQAASLP